MPDKLLITFLVRQKITFKEKKHLPKKSVKQFAFTVRVQ